MAAVNTLGIQGGVEWYEHPHRRSSYLTAVTGLRVNVSGFGVTWDIHPMIGIGTGFALPVRPGSQRIVIEVRYERMLGNTQGRWQVPVSIGYRW